MEKEYDVLGGYVPAFVQHLTDTGARLGLGARADEESGADSDSDAEDEYRWTPAERDAFFRAVSVYSRWRPDLIAACVPTRTPWEVWMYLEALEEGAAGQGGVVDVASGVADERRDEDMDVDSSSSSDARSQSGPDSDSDVDEDEDGGGGGVMGGVVCEPALEVSQAWIDVEERMAAWIVHQERLASGKDDAVDDTEAPLANSPPKRRRGRPRGSGKRGPRGRVRGRAVSGEDGHSPTPGDHSPSSEPTSRPSRKRKRFRGHSTSLVGRREALMGHLDVSHLLVLDNILREDEEAIQNRSKSREGSITVETLTVEDGETSPQDVDVSNLSGRTRDVSGSSPDPMIDPVLLALSGDVGPAGCQSNGGSNESLLVTSAQAPAQGLSIQIPPLLGTRDMIQDHSIGTHPNPTAYAEMDLSSYSPRSRRRIQKRLHMRRKRASLRENPQGAVSAGVERMKPGKKARSEPSEMPVSASVPCSEAPSDDEVELGENAPKRSKGGLTLPYKLKARFAESGVDAEYLRDQGMDLLNLSALGRLMGLWCSLEHEEDDVLIARSIDAELIRCLQAAVVSFVTDVMHRAVVWRERELRLKRRSQAWRHGDQITIGAIEHAVDVIGGRHHSHKEYFKSLEAMLTEDSSSPSDAEPDRIADPSPHRDMYAPLVRPPSVWKLGPLAGLSRTYEREATRTRRGPSADAEDELMSDATDESALAAELREEAEADTVDAELAAAEERALWGGVRK